MFSYICFKQGWDIIVLYVTGTLNFIFWKVYCIAISPLKCRSCKFFLRPKSLSFWMLRLWWILECGVAQLPDHHDASERRHQTLVRRESLRHPPDFRRRSRRQALDPETYICDNNSEPEAENIIVATKHSLCSFLNVDWPLCHIDYLRNLASMLSSNTLFLRK